jgi:hypothetical protein
MSKTRPIFKAAAIGLAAMFSFALMAQKQSVAIMQPTGNAAVTDMNKFNVRGALTEILVATGKYDALDRSRMDSMLEEMKFQRSAFADPGKAKELGKRLQADMMCVTELMKEGSEFVVEVQIIDVESGRIAHTESEHIENESNAEIRKAVQALVNRMLKVGGAAPAGKAGAASEIASKIRAGEKRNLQFGQFKWRVLEVLRDRALIITEDVIEVNIAYHHTRTDVTWEACILRRYLNGDFLQKFSESEERQILEIKNQNPNNPDHGTRGGNETNDKVFLLSIQEIWRYFFSDAERCEGVTWAKYPDGNMYPRWWWLRSPGSSSSYATNVSYVGRLGTGGLPVDLVNAFGGLRPALWLNL